jgi:hypothetical protein
VFHLQPGDGVHIPVNCPHWLKNDNNVSISLSVNFQYPDSARGNLYRANYALRKLGIRPTPPGQSPWRDDFKKAAVGGVVLGRNLLRTIKGRR